MITQQHCQDIEKKKKKKKKQNKTNSNLNYFNKYLLSINHAKE